MNVAGILANNIINVKLWECDKNMSEWGEMFKLVKPEGYLDIHNTIFNFSVQPFPAVLLFSSIFLFIRIVVLM